LEWGYVFLFYVLLCRCGVSECYVYIGVLEQIGDCYYFWAMIGESSPAQIYKYTRWTGCKKAAKFAYHMSESNWEALSQRRKISRIGALFKAYCGERAWDFIGDRLQRPNYLSRIDHGWKISNRRQRTDIGKYSFVNRTIRLWNRLPAEILGTLPCKPSAFRKRVRRVINAVN